jgi:hypothetical protein
MPCLPGRVAAPALPARRHTLPGPGERRLVVSHGVGCSTVPLRVFARPEVHVCEVVAGADDGGRDRPPPLRAQTRGPGGRRPRRAAHLRHPFRRALPPPLVRSGR